MMQSENELGNVPHRRRGRPAGKNRVPLSIEQRRARNALYERERRNETAEAMSKLAEVVGCDSNASNSDILATVLHQIQRASKSNTDDIENLKRINANLESQIAMIQSRLGILDDDLDLKQEHDDQYSDSMPSDDFTDDQVNLLEKTKKRKRSSQRSSISNTQHKRIKTESEASSELSSVFGTCYEDSSLASTDNDQHWNKLVQQPIPETEDSEEVSEAKAQLQTELYNEIYNSESQCSTESTICLDSLAQSLITVPTIRSPKKMPNFELLEPKSERVLPNPQCDVTTSGECDFQRLDFTLDILTEHEKCMVREIIDSDLLNDQSQQNEVPGSHIKDECSRFCLM